MGAEDKPAWMVVPPRVRSEVARVLGAPVSRARRAYGGYGPSATFDLTLADGRRAFFKGTYPLAADSGVVWSLDREEVVYRRLGHRIEPWAPAYLGSVRADGWHALLLELIAGGPVLPWTRSKVRRAVRSFAAFHASTLGEPLPAWLSRSQHHEFSTSWRRLQHDDAAIERLAGLAGPRRQEAAAWLSASMGALRRAERPLRGVPGPAALLHFDTRSDNVRLQGGLLRLFDWPFASVGPPEIDIAAFAQSIEAENGPPAEMVLGWYEAALPLRREAVIASVAGIAGYFADRAPRAEVPALPRLRTIQRPSAPGVAAVGRAPARPSGAILAGVLPGLIARASGRMSRGGARDGHQMLGMSPRVRGGRAVREGRSGPWHHRGAR